MRPTKKSFHREQQKSDKDAADDIIRKMFDEKTTEQDIWQIINNVRISRKLGGSITLLEIVLTFF